jgi:hypothetical protein
MIQWCAYCQRFLSEKAPFENYSLTHGICKPCTKFARSMTEEQRDKVKKLGDFQKTLQTLGQNQNYTEALLLIDQAVAQGIREVDILLGFLAPLLSEQSEINRHKGDFISDSFSLFILKLIETLRQRTQSKKKFPVFDILLAAQNDNQHLLGIQLLELWLCAESHSTKSISGSDDEIINEFLKLKPKVLGLTLSEVSQVTAARHLMNKIKNLSEIPPLFLAGGWAVKMGEIQASDLPEASLVADNDKLFLTIKTHLSLSFLYDLKLRGSP